MSNHNAVYVTILTAGLFALMALSGACYDGYHVEAFGTGIKGHKDGKVSHARFNAPTGMAACGYPHPCFTKGMFNGLYLADRDSNRIRGVTLKEGANGGLNYAFRGASVVTLAGTGKAAYADGPADSATFNHPEDVALPYWQGGAPMPPALFDLLVADTGNHCIRGVSQGHVTTIAGTGQPGFVDGPAGKAQFNQPAGVAVDHKGQLYIADRGNNRIRVYFQFKVSTLAGTGKAGNGDGPLNQAQFNQPTGVTVDSEGTIYVADRGNHRIRIIQNGQVSTLVDSGLGQPSAVGAYPGEVYVADTDNGLLRTIIGGSLETHEEGEGYTLPLGLAVFRKKVDGDEIIFLSDAGAHKIWLIESNHPNW